jgi:hypothetical protein
MNKLIKFPVWIVSVFGAIIILQACYPVDIIPIADLDTTTTSYNTDDLATAPKSAAIVWEVVHVELGDGEYLDYNGEVDDEILNTTLEELVVLYGEDNVKIIWNDSTTAPSPTPSVANIEVFVPDSSDPEPSVETLYAPSVIL